MAQFGRPDVDVSDGSWVATGGPTDIFDCLEEVTANDSEYARDSGNNTTCEVGIGTLTDPVLSTGHILHCRMRASGSGGPERVQIALFEGATQRAISGNITSRAAWGDGAYQLTTVQYL